MRQISKSGFTVFMLLFLSICAHADTAFTKRKDVQRFISYMVTEHHFNPTQLRATMNQVKLQPQIIESMDKPYEKKSWDVYRDIFLTASRLKGGLDYWIANQNALDKAQRQFGVPPEIIIAILGVETLYGERQGEYRVLDALATLAFNYPKRAAFFTKELKEYLLLCREHNVPATTYKGSYAGAIGQPQFMPSSYRHFAISFTNKKKRDLVTSNEDSIASIANYFHIHGWKTNDSVAQPARLTSNRYKLIRANPKTANYYYAQLIANGVKPVSTIKKPPLRAGLIELVTNKGNDYWLAYPNFFVITRYNSSPQYALVVYLLSQQLKQQWAALHLNQHRVHI